MKGPRHGILGMAMLGVALLGVAAMLASISLGGKSQAASPVKLSIPGTFADQGLNLDAWLLTPPGNGPFAAVIVAHGCNGLVGPYSDWEGANRWAAWLNQEGFAALILDSFTTRGLRAICGHGATLPIAQRAADIYAAALYLSKLPEIDPQHIGAIGFSHGGSTVLRAAADENPYTADARAALASAHGRLAAVVAMYPGCRQDIASVFSAAVLVVIGTADDWTPPAACQQLADFHRTAGAPAFIKVYPNATHAFDEPKGPRTTRQGHYLAYDAAATADSQKQIKSFFDRFLTGSGNSK